MGVEIKKKKKRYDITCSVKSFIVVQYSMELKDTFCLALVHLLWIFLQVIEHVADPAEFCKSLSALTVPDGATVISTINRSMRAYTTAIVAAEYILRWVFILLNSTPFNTFSILHSIDTLYIYWTPQLPRGTHQWSSFLTPEELVLILQRAGINVRTQNAFIISTVRD